MQLRFDEEKLQPLARSNNHWAGVITTVGKRKRIEPAEFTIFVHSKCGPTDTKVTVRVSWQNRIVFYDCYFTLLIVFPVPD